MGMRECWFNVYVVGGTDKTYHGAHWPTPHQAQRVASLTGVRVLYRVHARLKDETTT